MACTEEAAPHYTLEEVSAVRDAAGHVEVRGVVRNSGGEPDSTLCVRVECLGPVAAPREDDGGYLPGEHEGTHLLIDAQERCYTGGVDEDGSLPVAVTMGEATSARADRRTGDALSVRLRFASGTGPVEPVRVSLPE
jgi:hypothetical protein